MVGSDSLRSPIFILLAFRAVMLTVTGKNKVLDGSRRDRHTGGGRPLPGQQTLPQPRKLLHTTGNSIRPVPLSENDRKILADTAMNYRVMDVPRFYQAAPSYHHKAVGGYHAAKLTRYLRDLIDRHLSHFTLRQPRRSFDFRVLNMLNARHFIDQEGRLSYNPDALGNAWFVSKVGYVPTPDAEMEALQMTRPGNRGRCRYAVP